MATQTLDEREEGSYPEAIVNLPYEKPSIRRHAVIMTMAPQGSKMGHGLFPFATRRIENYENFSAKSPYRRTND